MHDGTWGCAWRTALFLLAIAASGCGRFRYEGEGERDAAAEPRNDAGGRVELAPPVPLTALNAGTHTHAPSLTADLLEVYFESARTGTDDLYRATRASSDEPFGAPEPVAELNTPDGETSPEVSADGLQIWFVSHREPSLGDYDVWTSRRASRTAPWDPPEHVPELSSPFVDHSAAPSPDTLAIVIHSDRGDGSGDLFIARRASIDQPWGTPEPVAGVNEPASSEAAGHLGPDLTVLYFSSTREGGAGSRDLYFATRATASDPFGAPQPIAGVNTADFEDEPWVSLDGTYMVFARDDGTKRELYETVRR